MTEMERFRQECKDAFTEDKLVFGEGPSHFPRLMLIGEAPGEQEALQGRPFVGKAGKNLDFFLEAVHVKREEIYITNVVKVRPTKLSAAGRIVNRPPDKEEKARFTPWLMREIVLVRPQAIVTLGNVALQAFVDDVIGNRHGRWSEANISSDDKNAFALPLFALYHPASVIYNRSLKTTYEADLQVLAETLPVKTNG
ncbi:MAG: uracil-DNA glycosylase [Clostridia bacterium]|nr:uracil-DNA glycosylase [Clostridia bacterium]